MSDSLPEIIDPLHLADKRGAFQGRIAIKRLDRLADKLHSDVGEVVVELFFGRQGRLATVDGTLETVLSLCCQNCLEALEWPVKIPVKLGVVTSLEQADKLADGFEPLLVLADTVLLKDIIEEELLLVLPTFPKHPSPCMISDHNNISEGLVAERKTTSATNPFSILANLKNTGDL
jgi:uncharacterized protein